MKIESYFSGIRSLLLEDIAKAEKSIDIAVAWFTDLQIYQALLEKISKKVHIRLIVINDDVNNRIGGLDFQKFINSGGEFYFGNQESPMHNKFCIIDQKILITGSYNYTYWADFKNEENVIRFEGVNDIVDTYCKQFETIIESLQAIQNVKEYQQTTPYIRNFYSFSNFIIRDAYQQSLDLKDKGLDKEAQKLVSVLDKTAINDDSNNNHFIIKNVVYRQWKKDYYADKVEVIGDEIIIYFRTNVESGWIFGPGTLGAWTIKNTENAEEEEIVDEITDVKIDGSVVVETANRNTVYVFNRKGKELSFETNYFKTNKNGKVKILNGKVFDKNGTPLDYQVVTLDKEHSVLECKIHFKQSELINQTFNLIEGAGTETYDNHWHCFDINMRYNREYQ